MIEVHKAHNTSIPFSVIHNFSKKQNLWTSQILIPRVKNETYQDMNPKRILFISPFDEPISGADESLLLVLKTLDRSQVEPHILLPPHSHYKERYEQTQTRVHVKPMSRLRRSYNPWFWIQWVWIFLKEQKELSKFFQEFGFSIIHLNMHVLLGPLCVANHLNIPVVTHYRAKTNDNPKIFFDFFLPWIYRKSSAIICISQAVANHFINRGLKEKIHVLHNPVPDEIFSKEKRPNPFESIPHLKNKKIVLFVGRIDPQKRIHVLLEALKVLSQKREDIAGVIVGSPANDKIGHDYAKQLQEQIQKEKMNVEWFPHQKDVFPFLQHSDVLVLPSVNEGFGRVLVEAMASGLPVIGANSGAIPEVLENGKYGQLVSPDNAKELAYAIERSLDDSSWKEFALKAKEYSKEKFAINEYLKKLIKFYKK